MDIQFVKTLTLSDGDRLDTLYIVGNGGTVSIEPGATLAANGGGVICLEKDALLSDSLSVVVEGTGKKRFFGLRFPFAESLHLKRCEFSDLRLMPTPPLEILKTIDSREKFLAHFRARKPKGLATAVEALRVYAVDTAFKGLSYGITEEFYWHDSEGGRKWTCVPQICAVNSFEVMCKNCRVESANFAVGGDLSFSAMFLANGLPEDLAISENASRAIRELMRGPAGKHFSDPDQQLKNPVAVSLNTEYRDCYLRYFCDRFIAAENSSFSGIYFNYHGLFTESLFVECSFKNIHRVTMSFGSSGICPRSYPGVFILGAVLHACTIEFAALPISLPEEVRELSHPVASACVFSLSAGAVTDCVVYSEWRTPMISLWRYEGFYSYVGHRIKNELVFKSNTVINGSNTVGRPTVVIEGREISCDFSGNIFSARDTLRLTIAEETTGSFVFNKNSCILTKNVVFDSGVLADDAVERRGFSHKMEQESTENLFDCRSLITKAVRLRQSVVFTEVIDSSVVLGANLYAECDKLYMDDVDVKYSVEADFDAGRANEGYTYPGKFGPSTPYYGQRGFAKMTAQETQNAYKRRKAALAQLHAAVKKLSDTARLQR